jgi:dolichol-phosphate mannosyltransferase
MTLVSVVVPVYCNAGSLPELYRCLAAVAAERSDLGFEFVFVDDGSFDESYAVLCRLEAADPRVQVVKLSRNFGSNAALTAGLGVARGACVAMVAADLQDPPELIGELVRRWENGTRVVLAARRTRGDALLTRLPAAVFNRLFRRLVFRDFPPNGFDFALIDRQIVDLIVQCAEKNSYIFGLIMWSGFRREVLEYDRAERRHGVSMWTFWRKVKYFVDAFSAFSYLPLRAASVAGMLLALVGMLYAVVVFTARIVGGIPVEGWATMMIVVLLASGTQMLMLGLIGEYVWRALEQSRSRPLFVVERQTGEAVPRQRSVPEAVDAP